MAAVHGHETALKREPLTRETASKTDENDSLLPHARFFSSLVFATVAHSALSLAEHSPRPRLPPRLQVRLRLGPHLTLALPHVHCTARVRTHVGSFRRELCVFELERSGTCLGTLVVHHRARTGCAAAS